MKREVKMHTKIGETLKKFRKLNKYSQQEVADKIGISRSTYAGYEKKTPPDIITMIKLSLLFNCSIDYLVYGYKKEYNIPLDFKEVVFELTDENRNYFWTHITEYARYLSKK